MLKKSACFNITIVSGQIAAFLDTGIYYCQCHYYLSLLFGAVQSVELIMCELLYMLSLYHTDHDLYCQEKKYLQGKERGECRES
jgi:hypothetical protein